MQVAKLCIIYTQIQSFTKTRPVKDEDGRTYTTRLIVAFRNSSVKASVVCIKSVKNCYEKYEPSLRMRAHVLIHIYICTTITHDFLCHEILSHFVCHHAESVYSQRGRTRNTDAASHNLQIADRMSPATQCHVTHSQND